MENFTLKSGMVFESPWAVGNYINCTWAKKCDSIYKALAHYCEFHKDKQRRIYIDKVFDEPIPFLRTDFVYNVGQVIETKYGKYEIIDRYLKKRYETSKCQTRLYRCKCLIDGYEFELNASEIKRGTGCLICRRKQIENGNSLYNTRPDLLKYLCEPDEAKNFCENSGKYIMCKCPECGSIKEVMIENLSRCGFSCTVCGDGVSYPNKFVNELLNQLGVKHEYEKEFSWSGKKRYDQYLKDYSMIIENNGLQHYREESQFQFPMQNLEKQQKNDALKRELAVRNGIKNYIYLDCSRSTQEWIKEHIMCSELPNILGFTENDIDWDKCSKVASSSIVKEVWKLWNDGLSSGDISHLLNISSTSVMNYIYRGVDCGICKPVQKIYSEMYVTRRNVSPFEYHQMKPIYCEDDDAYFSSRFECEKYYPDLFPENSGSFLLYKFISKGKTYKGKKFVYVTKEHFNEMLEKSKSDDSLTVVGKPFRL